MSFWGRIFGTDKAMESVVNGVTKGLDALVYTDEEKLQDAAKERAEARAMVVQWMAATQGQNVARRLIALSITAIWIMQYVIAQTVSVLMIFYGDKEKLSQVVKVLNEGAGDMNSAVMLILAFYFAAPHMGDIASAVIGKFTNRAKG